MRLFCKHKYSEVDTIPCTFEFNKGDVAKVPITLYECEKCGKREIIRASSCFYSSTLLKKIEMWRKGQLDW